MAFRFSFPKPSGGAGYGDLNNNAYKLRNGKNRKDKSYAEPGKARRHFELPLQTLHWS